MIQKKFTTVLGIIVLASIGTIIFTSLISAPSPQVFQLSGEKPLEEGISLQPKERDNIPSLPIKEITSHQDGMRIQTLEDQVKKLAAQIAALEQKYRNVNDMPASRDVAGTLSSVDSSPEDSARRVRDRREQLDRLVADRSGIREGDVVTAAQQIRAAINGQAFSHSSVSGIDCVASLCRIQVVHQGMDAQQKFVDTLINKLNDGGWNPATEVHMDAGQASNELNSVIYVTREGHTLPSGQGGTLN